MMKEMIEKRGFFGKGFVNEVLMGGGKLLLSLFLVLMLCTLAAAQNPPDTMYCGAFIRAVPPVPFNNELMYSDRFGNLYTHTELQESAFLATSHCNDIEDFNLNFVDNPLRPFTSEERERVCDVFTYLSALIERPAQGQRATFTIRKGKMPREQLAQGGAFYPEQCGMGHSLVHRVLFTGDNFGDIDHGRITVNVDETRFYTGADPAGIGSGEYDFQTMILHEALHALGFASDIVPGGTGNGFYTLWDLNLRNVEGARLVEALPVNNLNCCLQYGINEADFGANWATNIWHQDCNTDNLRFDVADLPPVNGEYPNAPQNNETFRNVLSHLDRDCGQGNYVMHYFIPHGSDGVQRALTNAEIAILCRLGYSLSGGCEADCIAIARDEEVIFLPPNGTTTVNVLLNDFVTPNAAFSYLPACGNHAGITVTPPVNGGGVFHIEAGTTLGVYTFCYALTDCNGLRCDVGRVRVVVWNPDLVEQTCANTPECELVSLGDFEAFNNQETMLRVLSAGAMEGRTGTGFSFGPKQDWDNTGDFFQSSAIMRLRCFGPGGTIPVAQGNNAAGLIVRNILGEIPPRPIQRPEGFAFPLCRPVYPGMRGVVTFLAATSEHCQNNHVRVEYSSRPPLAGRLLFENPGSDGQRDTIRITSNAPMNPTWDLYTSEFYNTGDSCWNYLYLSSFKPTTNENDGFGYILIDDVHLTLRNNHFDELFDIAVTSAPLHPCPGAMVDIPITICNNRDCGVNGGAYENPPIAIQATLPPGVAFVPSADFPTLTALIERGSLAGATACRTLTLRVRVDNNQALVGQTLPVLFRLKAECYIPLDTIVNIRPAGTLATLSFQCSETSGIPNDCEICTGSGDLITLRAQTNGNSFLWSTGATTQSITVSPTTTQSYTVTVTGPGLCPNSDFVSVVVAPCDFTCPCTDANTLNIDATVEHRYSVLEDIYNFDRNDDGGLSDGDHNGCIAINGRLEIDEDLSIGDAEIRMQPCSEIVVLGTSVGKNGTVLPGKKLSLSINNIHGCEVMWKGIRVEQGGTLYLFNNTLIADAEHAAWVVPTLTGSAGSATSADIRGNRFERNHVGLYIASGGGSGSVSTPSFAGGLTHTIAGNSFEGSNLLPSCSIGSPGTLTGTGYAGIVNSGSLHLTVGTSGTSGYSNAFNNLRFGIINQNGWLNVYRGDFSNITGGTTTGIPTAGAAVFHSGGLSMQTRNSRFSNCTYGIYGQGGNYIVRQNTVGTPVDIFASLSDPYSLDIYENWDLNFKEYGIRATGLRNYTIPVNGAPVSFNQYDIGLNTFHSHGTHDGSTENCAVLLSNAGGNPDMPTHARFYLNSAYLNDRVNGFVVNSQNRWQLTDNYVQFDIAGGDSERRKSGLKLSGAHDNYLYGCVVYDNSAEEKLNAFSVEQSQSNRFCCNYMSGTDRGAYFAGSCGGTKYRYNTMDNHTNPVYMNISGLTGKQGSETETYSNVFEEGSGIAKHEGDAQFALNSRFFVTDMSHPNWPDGVDPVNFFGTNGYPSAVCTADSSNCPPPDYGDIAVTKSSDPATAQSAFGGTPYGDALQWENERDLYARLKQNAALLGQSTAVDAFFAAREAGSALKAYYEADIIVQETDMAPASWIQEMQSMVESIKQTEALANQELLAGLSNANTKEDSLLAYQQASEIRAQAMPHLQTFYAMHRQLDSLRKVKAQAALPHILALPAENVLQSNRKTAHRVYLEWRAAGSGPLTPAQWASLSPIAHQCASEGGTAVYLARALYRIREDKAFDDNVLCQYIEERNAPINSGVSLKVRLWPNPGKDHINLLVSGIPSEEVIHVEITELSGKVVQVVDAHLEKGGVAIATGHLPSGMYFCQVRAIGELPMTLKFVVSK